MFFEKNFRKCGYVSPTERIHSMIANGQKITQEMTPSTQEYSMWANHIKTCRTCRSKALKLMAFLKKTLHVRIKISGDVEKNLAIIQDVAEKCGARCEQKTTFGIRRKNTYVISGRLFTIQSFSNILGEAPLSDEKHIVVFFQDLKPR